VYYSKTSSGASRLSEPSIDHIIHAKVANERVSMVLVRGDRGVHPQ